jgi:hypothetical protein
MAEYFDTLFQTGKELLQTLKSKWKLSTLVDLITEKAMPATVSEDKLEEFYAQRMKELYRIIYDM